MVRVAIRTEGLAMDGLAAMGAGGRVTDGLAAMGAGDA